MDKRLTELADIPYTISYVVRKRMQIDNLNELPKDKKVPENMLWDSSSEEIEKWLEETMSNKKQSVFHFNIKENDVEG